HNHFLFTVASGRDETSGIYVGSINSSETKRLLSSRSRAIYSAGYIFFMRENNLMAQPFDLETLQLKGEAINLVQAHLDFQPGLSTFSFPGFQNRILTVMNAGHFGNPLVWCDRNGRLLSPVSGQSSLYVNPTLSPDGSKL